MATREELELSPERTHLPRASLARLRRQLAARSADLDDSEQRFRSLYEAIACGVMVRNARGEVVEANHAAQKIFGLELDAMLGKRTEELWNAYDEQGNRIPADRRPSMLALKHQETVRGMVLRMVPRTGVAKWLQVDAVPLFDAAGNVRQIVSSFIDITERKRVEDALRRSEAALEHQALHDSLTGLPNRTLFHDRLQQAVLLGERHSQPAALLFLDLDKFKDVNDSLGHDAGDEVLKEMATRMRKELRSSDTVARMGGDEFATLLPGVAEPKAAAVTARKLLEAVARPVTVAGARLNLGASVGIAIFPLHASDPRSLMRAADLAMYEAKGSTAQRFQIAHHD